MIKYKKSKLFSGEIMKNRSTNIWNIVFLVLAIALTVAIIALLIYQFAVEKTVDPADIAKALIVIVGLGIAFVKRFGIMRAARPAESNKAIREQYKTLIGDAFKSDSAAERRLLRAIRDYQRDNSQKALRRFEKLRPSCKTKSETFAVNFFIALCYDDLGIYPVAIRHYESALAIRENSTALSNLGLCYQRVGDEANAEESYRRAIELDPSNAYVYNNLAQLLIYRAEYAESLEYAQKATSINANIAASYSAQAICLALLDESDAARKAAERYAALGGDVSAVYEAIQRLREGRDQEL